MQEVADLVAALPQGARPLKLVWCVPRRLCDDWQAPAVEGTVRHTPQKEGMGASAADMQAVQQYALRMTLRQRKEQQPGFEWV